MDLNVLLVAPVVALALFLLYRRLQAFNAARRTPELGDQKHHAAVPANDPYTAIECLTCFDWRTTESIFNAPLKPKYHLTMALENIPLSELIEMDNTHLDRMRIRREIMAEHEEATLQCNSAAEESARELYEWLIGTYLPGRFPMLYSRTAEGLRNEANGEIVPWRPKTAKEGLRNLGEHIDTDFLLLLPSSTAPDASPIYHLEAFVTCFPSGFSTREKLGLPLAQIHTPVPGYKAKLEKSMDRFFARIECGRCVKRSNWALTTNDALFADGGFHLYEGGKTEKDVRETEPEAEEENKMDVEAAIEKQKAEVVVEDCRLRSERQTLFRLPKTKALVFSFKTYQYRLEDVKRDGYGEALAEAMEGLARGNVPEMDFYKRGVVWREKVVDFLRS